MKTLFLLVVLLATSSVFANSTTTFNLDDVDTITAGNKTVIVEDLRDGFEKIRGVNVTGDKVNVSSESKVKVQFKSNAFRFISTMSARSGGDMGGG